MIAVAPGLAYANVWLCQLVLEQARDGRLRPTWRDELPLLSNAATSQEPIAEDIKTAVADIRQKPYAAWEPNHAPDWRTALDAWYVESRGLLAWSYIDNTRRHTATMAAIEDVLATTVRRHGPGDGSTPMIRLLTSEASMDDFADQARNRMGQNHAQTRDWLTASYLAGLAAGGDDIDWVEWLKTRLAQWPPDNPATRRANTEFNRPAFRETLQRLPPYWTC